MPKLLAPEKRIDPRLELTLNMVLRVPLAPGDFIQSIHGRIFVQYDQDESKQMAGSITASLLQFGYALELGVSADQLFATAWCGSRPSRFGALDPRIGKREQCQCLLR